MKKVGSLLAVLVVVVLSLAGCSKLSDDQIKNVMIIWLTQRMSGTDTPVDISIKNFVKTNGFQKDASTYIADVKCELVVKEKGKPEKEATIVPVQGQFTFIKGEKGWMVQEHKAQ